MNAIIGMTAIARANLHEPEKVNGCLGKINVSSMHLLRLINEVLDMSKIESGKVDLVLEDVSLPDVVDNIVSICRPMMVEKQQEFKVNIFNVRNEHVITDGDRLQQVFMNLLSNAIKYTPEGGKISLTINELKSELPTKGNYEFIFTDNGIGMPDEYMQHIFEPFAQEHAGSRTKFAGTGLGMPIAKNLVEKMGGTITFESAEGIGTTFVIRVPFKIDLDADKREESKDVSEKSIKGMHVLLAEDNELNMEIAEFLLQNEGAEVTKAWNGQEIVELFRKSESGEFDVILMDIMMPIINGYEAAKRIRSLDREDAKKIPIIAMTANAFTEDRIRAKEAGMDEHVAKPIDVELLIKVIHKLVKHN